MSSETKDPLILFFFFFTDESRVCLETQKEILLAPQRQGEKVILLKMTPQQNKEDILPTKHSLPPTPLHIHPGTARQGGAASCFASYMERAEHHQNHFLTKSEVLCPGMASNDHVLFGGDSFILTLWDTL